MGSILSGTGDAAINETVRSIIVIGHPGSGKSAFCGFLKTCLVERGIDVTKIDAYAYLQGLFRRDHGRGETCRFEADPVSEFLIKDAVVLDEALDLVRTRLRAEAAAARGVPIVELAFFERPALAAFLEAVRDSVIIHVDAPLPVCVARNAARGARVERSLRVSSARSTFDTDLDVHYVPASYYDRYRADPESWGAGARLLAACAGGRVWHVDNAADDLPAYEASCRALVETVLLPCIDRGLYRTNRAEP